MMINLLLKYINNKIKIILLKLKENKKYLNKYNGYKIKIKMDMFLN